MLKEGKMKRFKKGIVSELFSEESDWGEEEPIEVEGLGWLIFRVEDNAGTITIMVSKEKVEEFPIKDEEWARMLEKGAIFYKMLYLGTWGNPEGEGCLYYNLKEGKYTEHTDYKTYDESNEVLEKRLIEDFFQVI